MPMKIPPAALAWQTRAIIIYTSYEDFASFDACVYSVIPSTWVFNRV